MYKNEEEKEKRLLKLIGEGLIEKEIADIEQVPVSTVSRWIRKIDTNKVEEARRRAKEAKEKRILKLIAEGLSEEKIASEEGVSVSAISKCIRKIDTNKIEEARRRAKEAREERLLKLIAEGLSEEKIASKEEVSLSTVAKWISKIDTDKVEEARRRAKEAREERLLKLIREGLSEEKIASKEEVSLSTVAKWISKIDKKKVEEARKKGKEVRKESKREELKEETRRKRLKQKLEDHTITIREIIEYRKELDNKHDLITMDEIILMLNIYIKTKQSSKAISFIDSLVNDENIKIDKNKLKQLKEQTIKIQRKQEERRLSDKDLSTSANNTEKEM